MKFASLLAGIAGALIACYAGHAAAITPGQTTVADFSDGMQDWHGRVGVPTAGTTTWDTSLGNDAPSLHTVYNDFLKVGLRFYTDSAAFTGDYTQAQSITISLDINPIRMAVGATGAAAPKELYVDLLDFDNPAEFYDASFASFKLTTLDAGTGWQTYSVTITAMNSAALPAGWTAVDASGTPTMAAGMTFAQLLAGVDEIAFRIPPTRQGSALAYDVAVDNITISSVSAVPEPASAALMLAGLVGVGVLRRRGAGAEAPAWRQATRNDRVACRRTTRQAHTAHPPPMSPTHYSRFAERAFPYRWWLGLAAAAAAALVVLLFIKAGAAGARFAAAAAGPLIGLPWAALCAAIWFHPVHGNIQPASRLVGRLPKPVQAGMRWYAAAFLTLFVLMCAVAMPLFVLVGR